ncbi:MAG: LysM peptidoglycan-binding domain-containing protein, partial [Proteobacteria bacterium]|nr:LysM peptidoglycan-binding domain-containing protein [Pseudomonadota bacterium]
MRTTSASSTSAAAIVVIGLWLTTSIPAQAHNAIVHIVRQGETLASIAERYYGEPRFERVLVAENGLTTEGGSAIVVG